MSFVRRHWRRRDKAAWVRVGRTTRPRMARLGARITTGGDACISYLAFNGKFLAANAAPAAADAILSAGWWCLPMASWERSGPRVARPVEQRHPTHRRTASFPGQAVPANEPHPNSMPSLKPAVRPPTTPPLSYLRPRRVRDSSVPRPEDRPN
jgi:hypothetical protein